MTIQPIDPFVRDVLALRQLYRHSLVTPESSDSCVIPISIETREPDLQSSAKVLSINPLALSLTVDHPEIFRVGDRVLVLQRGSHETLVGIVPILEIVEQTIYLDKVDPETLMLVRADDLLVKEAKQPSIVLSYVDTKIPHLDKDEINTIRENLRNDPIDPPHHGIVRTPGFIPHGVYAQHFPLPGSPIPSGRVVLPIGPQQGIRIRESHAGWMLRQIIHEDLAFQRRWKQWMDIEHAGQLPRNRDLPYIRFGEPDEGTIERLKLCLTFINSDWHRSPQVAIATIEAFFDWLLWSVGHPLAPEFPEALRHNRAHDFMYQVFSVGRIIVYPADYFGELLAIADYPGVVPMQKALKLAKSIFPGRRNDYREQLLLDPECSSGALMLASSNYSYQYQGMTQDPLLAKAAILNAYFYAPWCIFPFDFLPTPDPVTTLTTSLMAMRHHGIDPRYFGQIQLTSDYQRYLPIALVEPQRLNALMEWLTDHLAQPLPSQKLPALPEPDILPTQVLPPSAPPELPAPLPPPLPPREFPLLPPPSNP